MIENFVSYDSIFIPLSAALGLSLTIERILEFIKNVSERIINRKSGRKVPKDSDFKKLVSEMEKNYQREKLSREIEKKASKLEKEQKKLIAEIKKEGDHVKRNKLKSRLKEMEEEDEWEECFPQTTVLVEPATDQDDAKMMKAIILQLLGFAAGIIAVHFSGVQLFNSFLTVLGQSGMSTELDYLLTGLLIGGGSQPMHILVGFITQNKVTLSKEDISEKKENDEPAVGAPSPAPGIIEKPALDSNQIWIDIPYKGGVDREKMEHFHVRKKDPEMVIYHHTAMSSDSTFEDVVRVIKDKTDAQGNHWLTGYNCVVLADGSINPFCRWDRYGNHAYLYNGKSLGIALNGNFEINPNVSYSNFNGEYGSKRPNEAQLKNTARVIALWSFLYEIDIDFNKRIIPHGQVSSSACPGSNFPNDEFKKWIEFFVEKWQKSDSVQEQIEAYKLKPYLYVKESEVA